MCGIVYATWDVHTHTSNGTIITYPTVTVTGTHYFQALAPTSGHIYAFLDYNSMIIAELDLDNGACQRTSLTMEQNRSYTFSSEVSGYSSGTGKAWVANSGNPNLPTCGGG
jgi:hypothetical protein